MAQLSHHSLSWVGYGFNPGSEHSWWAGPIPYDTVVDATAHAVQLLDREIMVKDIRTHVDVNGNRVVYLTVRNTGFNNIPGYSLNLSLVRS